MNWMKVADRVEQLPPYPFASLASRIRQLNEEGKDVIRLDMGSPDLPPPGFVLEVMYGSARDASHHGYPGFSGTPELRRAVATYYVRRFGVELDPDREVVCLLGSKEGIVNVALTFVDPGDMVLVPDPGYLPYSMGTVLAGGKVHRLSIEAENRFLPDLDAVPSDVARSAKILWLNYPNNPTGAIAPLDFFERVVRFAQQHELLICHDNPYCDVTFEGYTSPSILQVPGAQDVALEFNSVSKTYNMAGWRVGMAVGSATAVQALARTKTNIDSGIFRPLQDAATAVLNGDQSWLQERNEIYRKRRDLILRTLQEIGIPAQKPQASLYVWAEVPPGQTSSEYASRLLEEAGVSITPGTVFGPGGEGFVRISLGMSSERIREAMERWRSFSI
jgi:LL-diaminopimelate aminotransferase